MSKQQNTKKKAPKKIIFWIIAAMVFIPVIYLMIWNAALKYSGKEYKVDSTSVKANIAATIPGALQSAISLAETQPNENNYINLSLEYYNNKMFRQCIQASEKALTYNPNSVAAYNNICSAWNELKNYTAAEKACTQALRINPEHTLAGNNLKVATAGKAKILSEINDALVLIKTNPNESNYTTLGNLYYADYQFEKAISTYKKIIEIDAANANAYNNICAAYNELGKYTEAKKYCEKALEIDATFELAKNNLKVSTDSLKK